jgi:micrococcal nuclease
MIDFLYHYKMTVIRVVDGDTVYGDVDLGFNSVNKKMEFRLAKINTPEIKGATREAGLTSKVYVEEKIMGKEVIIVTKKDSKEKYGRYLAEVFYKDGSGAYVSLNDELVQKGLAVPFMS